MVATHVLISRPAPEADALARGVSELGLKPVVVPAFAFRATESSLGVDPGWSAATRRLAVFTSPRSVAFGLPRIEAGLLEGSRIAAIGPATQAALEAAGWQVDLAPDGRSDSEGLLATLETSEPGGMALIFTAPGGRKLLRDRLAEHGWQVRELFVYERDAMVPDADAEAELAGAGGVVSLWTSGQAMRQLTGHLAAKARRRVLDGEWLVASERLGVLARELGAGRVRVCGGADNDTLLRALTEAVADSDG